MRDVDNGTSDVAAVEADGAIDIEEGPVFELDTAAPECNGAICVSMTVQEGSKGAVSSSCRTHLSLSTCWINDLQLRPPPSRRPHPPPVLSPRSSSSSVLPQRCLLSPPYFPPTNLTHPKCQFVQHQTRADRRRWERLGAVYRDGLQMLVWFRLNLLTAEHKRAW